MFYCDAKYSDTWQGSSRVCCYLFIVNYSKWFKERILFKALAACSFLCNAVLYPEVGLGTPFEQFSISVRITLSTLLGPVNDKNTQSIF